ncbi:hypothetical protein ASPVEDRAFT_26379 [Aspergillus versicolor CBS 583.65]|uniref:Zn(2)-C6 fungal-type domain-containing protein n=1 Tax=Aspergillus versicolor CBS 583.65 TaxID=1036611 RepID=A0A1L9PDJ2_ASPVE|nr:uncharacterized protein ASPVEDRAFT_26379 [Aspergillus versicolor CBS 583.65]OJI99580.1 hypothetical protein ASPVEDRAFT_26379 [Aspergillus versicolor CBS 583.65]
MPGNDAFKKRSRSGCRTCRKRHQKCDERKPTCWNCHLRGIKCGGYGITLTNFTAYSGVKGQMVSKMMRDDPDSDSSHDENVPNVATSASMPQAEVDREQPESPFPSTDLAVLPASEAVATEVLDTLCLDSRTNSVSPSDVSMSGQWLPASDQPIEDEGIIDFLPFSSIPEPTLQLTPRDPFDQYLFRYYMDNLSLRLYPVKRDQNPYRIVYGNLATQSEPLFRAIMLASALHLSKLGKLPKFAIKHYRTAMQESFRDNLKKGGEAWSLGATVLLSVVFDIIGTGMDTWSSRLIGCRRLLEMAVRMPGSGTHVGLQCVLLQYNWAVTMGKTLLRGLVPPATFDELKCTDEASAFPGAVEGTEMATQQSQWFDNLPDYQMHVFLREATEYSLTVDRLKALPGGVEELLQMMPRVADLVHRIEAWQPCVSAVQAKYVDSVQHFNEIWRLGMLCFIYSEIYSLGPSDYYLQTCVEESLEPLRKLSWLQACLFPMFMIAVHAQTEAARTSFMTKLTEMHVLLGFQGPLSVASTLKHAWERSDNTEAGKVKWREVIRELGMELNILL